jgi:CRP/FNR family transcriptional regulator, anaerobic regulatory protein
MAISAYATIQPSACSHCAVRSRSICGALDGEEICALNEIATRKTLHDGEFFVFEGDAAQAFANVVSGVVKLTQSLEDGREQIVGVLFPSDFFGRAFGSQNSVYPCTVQATGEVNLCIFPAARFDQLLVKFPNLERKMLEQTQKELDTARDWLTMLGRKTAPERVATFLYHFATRSAEAGCKAGHAFEMPFTRADIADFTGLTYETVSRQISILRKQGIIVAESPRHISFVDMERLAERAGRGLSAH